MEVVIIGSRGFDTLEYNLADSFRFLGHNVTIFDLDDVVPLKYVINYHAIKYLPKFDEFIFNKLAKKVIAKKPDLVVGTYRFINPKCIELIKKSLSGIPIIHVNPDALTTFERQQIFASPYDFYFSKDPYIINFMREKMDLNAYYLPEAFNPRIHKKPDCDRTEIENKINIDVLVFGFLYPYRINMIKKIINAGVDVAVFGKSDKRFSKTEVDKYFRNEWITGNRKSELLFGSKIVFNNFHYAEIDSVNCKFFEIGGIGAFQICDYRSTVDQYSKVDSSKFTFKSINEAIDLIKYYIDKPLLRYDIANQQYAHFMQNHTYEHRVKKILEIVF